MPRLKDWESEVTKIPGFILASRGDRKEYGIDGRRQRPHNPSNHGVDQNRLVGIANDRKRMRHQVYRARPEWRQDRRVRSPITGGKRVAGPRTARPTPPAVHISHTYSDHVSILKFIEHNWTIAPVTARSRDNFPNPIAAAGNPYVPTNGPAIGNLTDLFHF
jgi:hypothetical protein